MSDCLPQLALFDGEAFFREWLADWWVDGDGWVDGRCRARGRGRTELGHDPCIANLPGVRFACCGHGCEPPYLVEGPDLVHGPALEEWTLRDENALERMRRLGGDPP